MEENDVTNIHHHHLHLHEHNDDHVEEAEEALSLCDLALDFDSNKNPENDSSKLSSRSRRSSTESAPEFFEFLSDLSSDMCPADDIIFCGKLIPLQQQPLSFQTQKEGNRKSNGSNGLRKRSESLSELYSSSVTRSDSTKSANLLRNSRSLDYQKLHLYNIDRNPSTKSVGKSDVSPKKTVKPRWYVFMFGIVKFPPEMELKDIKSRQSRRTPSAMFPSLEDGGKNTSGIRSSGKGSSWSLLKALSCRDHTSVAVTASFCMPQA